MIAAAATASPVRAGATVNDSPQTVAPVWSPPPSLRDVRVGYDCRRTRRGIGVTIQPNLFYPHGAIYLCPERARNIEAAHPGASEFFLVHEYGHLFLSTRDEAAADRWAAAQLAATPGAKRVLLAAIAHFTEYPDVFDPLYGSNLERAWRVAESGRLPRPDWPDGLVMYERRRQSAREQQPVARLELKPGYVNQAETILIVNGRAVGYLSTQQPSADLICPPLPPPRDWEVEAADVWLYHHDPGKRPVEVARGLTATCKVPGSGGKRLVLSLGYDDQLTLSARLR